MADQGRVALTRGDLGFSHLKHSFAGGLTLRAGKCVHLLTDSDPPRRACSLHYRPDEAADRELRPCCEQRRRRMGSAPY